MVRDLSIERTQWAVGNGFFHSGTISHNHRTIRYIYDCGALKRNRNQDSLRREVREFSDRLNKEKIDVMFISHFDFDHVSGIPQLTRSADIKRFVIPLTDPVSQLFNLAKQSTQGTIGPDTDPELLDPYINLIVDPVSTLSDLAEINPEAITSVPPSEIGDQENQEDQGAERAPNGIDGRDLSSRTVGVLKFGEPDASGVKIMVGGEEVWQFHYFCVDAMDGLEDAFANQLIADKLITYRSELSDQNKLRKLIANHWSDIAKSYLSLVKRMVGTSFDRNITSLMLYSGPPLESRIQTYRSKSTAIERAQIGAWSTRPGWIGLGDVDLRSTARLNFVNNSFKSRKPYTGTFAPSHHGSHLDWDRTLSDGFADMSEHAPTYVFGASGAYNHPSHSVLLDINELGGTTVIVGLESSSRWTERLKMSIQTTP